MQRSKSFPLPKHLFGAFPIWTIKFSNILGGVHAVFRNVFVHDLEETAIPGMSESHAKMWEGVQFHDASDGPLQMMLLPIKAFLQASLPSGSIRLRSYGARRSIFSDLLTSLADQKRDGLDKVLRSFLDSRFILIDDFGEQDLELYALSHAMQAAGNPQVREPVNLPKPYVSLGRASKSDAAAASVLVVCPLALIGQWADEIQRLAPGFSVLKHGDHFLSIHTTLDPIKPFLKGESIRYVRPSNGESRDMQMFTFRTEIDNLRITLDVKDAEIVSLQHEVQDAKEAVARERSG
ncbi:hypothetical protein M378DRAFT_17745 [Amanita muscaria Koide BX008]|uniref:Phosphatidate phosphatase APP1 catalytic domain-containing protein n=1 Tax=Amanita muscaria (strain Koide BX008) TaxID=946122 RepID=A0A0C2RZ71_AMAMK|nr:hypothetical protein M378DRAFT_17745 [Amanita muscaria Koide BX008]